MQKKSKIMLIRIIVTAIIFFPLLVAEHMGYFEGLPAIACGAIFVIPYVIIGYDIVGKACRNIRNGQVFDENFLMMLATFGAFAVREFSESVAVMLFYQVGELFQTIAVGKSRQAIADMMDIAPAFANLVTDEGTEQVDPDEVEIGSIILVRPGEKIPLDGVVTEGESMLDTKALTGESIPVKVQAGDDIYSGCINGNGILKIRTVKEYDDCTVAKILELVEEAGDKKATVENFITRFARYYTPFVTISALLLVIFGPIISGDGLAGISTWILRACTFLVVSCPCALVISVPMGFFGGIGAASTQGILVKGSNYLELMAKVNTIVFDKTGTLTKGVFAVSQIKAEAGFTEEEILTYAAGAESVSTHPIAQSIVAEAAKRGINASVQSAEEISGHGMSALVEGKKVLAGNGKLLDGEKIAYTENTALGTIVYIAVDGHFAGSIAIADEIKEGAKNAIAAMKKVGIEKVVMLTGDREAAAKGVADALGVDEYHASLLPADKVKRVEELLSSKSKKSCIAFVGDGINDAPVLRRADVGIAMGSMGSDAAIEAADIVLMNDDIAKIASSVKIARRTRMVVNQNIVFALTVKTLVLILGALGIANMWAAVFADVGVAVIAILNAMRALKVDK